MAWIWQVLYILAVGAILWLLHTGIGSYPNPLPRSEHPRRELSALFLLWGIALIFSISMVLVISPWINRTISDRTVRQFVEVPLLSIVCIGLPYLVVFRRGGWTAGDLGLTWRVHSTQVAVFALLFGILSGCIAYFSNQTVVGVRAIAAGELLLLLYNNAFVEEFLYRGVIQSGLERAAGQTKAILWGGLLFGLTHIVFDFSMLMKTSGLIYVILAFILQVMAGWLFGIIFMKTRSLWPGVACHYLVNWMPSILVLILG
jgi:membrane protease YdiL (CAAX protease family)